MRNFTLQLLEFLPFCSYSDILQNGTWTYPGYLSDRLNEPHWDMCPETETWLLADKKLSNHKSYSCLERNYTKARFHTPGCNILPLKDSLRALQSHGAKFLFVGDSLTIQQFVSLRCASERFYIPDYQSIPYQVDIFLRGDIPCDPRCLTDPAFRQQEMIGLRHPCFACLEKDPRDFSNYASNPEEWHHRLPTDTTAIIIGSGAWYNLYKGIMNSTFTYAETLHALGPVFLHLQKTRGIDTFWHGLPPHNINISVQNSSDYGYEWIFFTEKDYIAKTILEPYGVTFLDTDRLTKARKARDPWVAADGLHWCNPGLDAVPTFLNRVIFHLLAMKKVLGMKI